MVSTGPIRGALGDLRRLARSVRRSSRLADAMPLLVRILASGRITSIEERAGGIAIGARAGGCEGGSFSITCVIRDDSARNPLTRAEAGVAGLLCDGRTLAQIASLRGVSINTVKSQVRQIFRKLDVDTRVALVRRLCP